MGRRSSGAKVRSGRAMSGAEGLLWMGGRAGSARGSKKEARRVGALARVWLD